MIIIIIIIINFIFSKKSYSYSILVTRYVYKVMMIFLIAIIEELEILKIFIENITMINHRLSIKDFNELYSDNPSAQNKKYFDKAFKI